MYLLDGVCKVYFSLKVVNDTRLHNLISHTSKYIKYKMPHAILQEEVDLNFDRLLR